MALGLPAVEAVHEVAGRQAGVGEQALGEAQGRGGVVGPAAGLEAEGAAPDHVGDRGEAAPGHELDRGAHGVADRQPEQGAAGAAERVGGPAADAELCCDVAGLAMAYLGDRAPSELVATRWWRAVEPAAVERADAAFATAVRPWCGTYF